ncbi:MAG: 2OG-Fe(II) oxygenase [Thiobacillus sp.]|nr:2OG-Fe(II) oxygenase [Thiobacillus sp.]
MNAPGLDHLLDDLAGPGWHVDQGFLGAVETAALREECLGALAAGAFHAAGVGSGQARVDGEIRGDHVLWVEEDNAGPALKSVLARLEALRQAVNRGLFMGLADAELHFAAYPPGAGYQRHLDRFRDDDRRTLTVILYLNPPDWHDEDGGHLLFWEREEEPPLEIAPLGGTLVAFLSERFWHQVQPARRQRLSLTGWFRRR